MPLFLGGSEVQVNLDGKVYTIEYQTSSSTTEANTLEDSTEDDNQ